MTDSATDNRTTELTATDRLRAMLDERDVDWIADDSDVLLVTRWKTENSKPAMYMEPVGECCEGWNNDFSFYATPEQAIAATLGSDVKPCYATDYTHEHCKYSVNRGWVENAELGSGTLTAEQVCEAIERHVKFYEGGDYDEQAIADELNAELGSGTCHSTTDNSAWCFACSECGKSFPRNELHLAHNHGEINYCPNCGKAVER